jgi:hypothetical protein
VEKMAYQNKEKEDRQRKKTQEGNKQKQNT